ncbi:MAG: DJ-1/PfpI family protein, partial [Oscillospiraceae bacterium]|nr:DJ-1/PfpI family protein [Oscillospiraceae bacterium]
GLLKGRCAVCYPGMEDYMQGAKVIKGCKVVLDKNIMTAQGPGAAGAFALNILAWLRGKDAAEEVRGDMYHADVDYVV